jgi:hypothetical protein
MRSSISFARHLCKTRAALHEFHLNIGSDEIPLVLAIANLCDLSELHTAVIRVTHGNLIYFDHFEGLKHDLVIDFCDPEAEVPRQEQYRRIDEHEQGIYSHISELMQQGYSHLEIPTQKDCPRIEELLASSCPALTHLRIRPVDLEFNCTMPALQELELIGSWGGASDRLREVVHRMPSIKILRLESCAYAELRFTPLSLEVIDLTKSRKGAYICELNCPALREIRCTATCYGNGVRPCVAGRLVLKPSEWPAEFNLRNQGMSCRGNCDRDAASFQRGVNCDSFVGQSMRGEWEREVEVPRGCVVRIETTNWN